MWFALLLALAALATPVASLNSSAPTTLPVAWDWVLIAILTQTFVLVGEATGFLRFSTKIWEPPSKGDAAAFSRPTPSAG